MNWNRPLDYCTQQTAVLLQEAAPAFTLSIDDAVKAALRVDDGPDDDLLTNLEAAVVPHLEQRLNTRLAQRSVTFTVPFLGDDIVLPLHPISAITGLTYLDSSYARQTLDSATYQLVLKNGFSQVSRRFNKVYPSDNILEDNAVQITCTVGYADQSSIPAALIQALIVMVCDQYRNPDRPLSATTNVDYLIAPFRKGEWVA